MIPKRKAYPFFLQHSPSLVAMQHDPIHKKQTKLAVLLKKSVKQILCVMLCCTFNYMKIAQCRQIKISLLHTLLRLISKRKSKPNKVAIIDVNISMRDPVHDTEWILSQMDTIPTYTISNGHYSKWTRSLMDTISNEHLHSYSYFGVS